MFLGMCSLHPEVGITVGDREEAYVKQANDRGFNGSGWPDFTWEMGHLCLTWSVLLPD